MTSKDFSDPNHLKEGTEKQAGAYQVIVSLGILDTLSEYGPMIVGTIPIGIDLENSDIDIVCKAEDVEAFARLVRSKFGGHEAFKQYYSVDQGIRSSFSSFCYSNFQFEIFAQPVDSIEQNAYQHMLVEHRILETGNAQLKEKILELKLEGYKTEPAFADLLNLKGDPYKSLLKIREMSDEELKELIGEADFLD